MANPYSKNYVWMGIGLIAMVVFALTYVLVTGDGPPIVRAGVQAVRDLASPAPAPSSAVDPPSEEPAKPAAPAAARERPRETAPAAPAPSVAPLAPTARPAPAATDNPPVVLATRGTPAPSPAKPVARRTDFYLPGSVAAWTTVDVVGGAPLRLRAGGVINTPDDSSGPNGLGSSVYERALDRRRAAATSERVMASGPYLALIGRICRDGECSSPFVVGSARVLCPSELDAEGRLQLWTNNYVQVDGTRTVNRFSTVTGGYAVYAEPAPESVCSGTAHELAADTAPAAETLNAGMVLRKPEFVVSSGQITWKPFFLPLSLGLRVTAHGEMRPRGSARSTGPDGIRVPDQPRWVYPGTSDLLVDADNRLYDSRFPYQALIGRVCGSAGCGPAFLVGKEHTICAPPGYTDRLELWINHIIRPESMLGRELSVSMEAFEMQGRRGQYAFEVTRAPEGCKN